MESINSNSEIVGYRFHPTDKELVDHYLWNKILGRDSQVQAINQVDGLFNKNPSELPCYSKIKSSDQVWYFFSRREDKKRVNRASEKGFWKVTGKPRHIKGKKGSAVKKTLVFYEGRTSNKKWTAWVIHEYIFTSPVPENKEGIFLCKLKNKQDDKADASSNGSCQQSQIVNDGIAENPTMFNPEDMLATLDKLDGSNDAKNNPCENQLPMHEDHVPSCEEFAHPHGFGAAHNGVEDLSDSSEQNDESWTKYLVNVEDYPIEGSNEQIVEDKNCNLPLTDRSMTHAGESSRKRSRFEDGLSAAIGNEDSHAMYEQEVSASSVLGEHSGSKKLHAMAMVNAPNVNLPAVKYDPCGRERMLAIHNESRETNAPSADVSSLHYTFHIELAERRECSSATRVYQKEISQNLIEQEDGPERITKSGKCSGIIFSQDKTTNVNHVTAINLPQKENSVMKYNRNWKTEEQNNGNTSLQMHLNESSDIDEKGSYV